MKKIALILCFLFLPHAVQAEDITNWFFDFHLKPIKEDSVISFAAGGNVQQKSVILSQGSYNDDKSIFTLKGKSTVEASPLSQNKPIENEYSVIWKKIGDHTFTGTITAGKPEDPKDSVFTLKLEKNNTYTITTDVGRGLALQRKGTLKDGVLTSTMKIVLPDGKVVGTGKTTAKVDDSAKK